MMQYRLRYPPIQAGCQSALASIAAQSFSKMTSDPSNELGLVAAKGREGLHQLVTIVMESCGEKLLSDARFACQAIVMQLHAAQTRINGLDKRIIQAHRVNADSKRLNAIPARRGRCYVPPPFRISRTFPLAI
jgi:hypothetical protein